MKGPQCPFEIGQQRTAQGIALLRPVQHDGSGVLVSHDFNE
jgi:hypothetical protein